MTTTLYASVSLNGQLLLHQKKRSPSPPEVFLDFMRHVHLAGNMVMGRSTALSLAHNRPALKCFADLELVVVSTGMKRNHHFKIVSSPAEALTYLAERNFEMACIAGGAQTYNSFLTLNLVDELVLNMNAEITTNGMNWISQPDFDQQWVLNEVRRLTPAIIQMRLSKSSVINV